MNITLDETRKDKCILILNYLDGSEARTPCSFNNSKRFCSACLLKGKVLSESEGKCIILDM